MDILRTISTRFTSQSVKADARQVENAAGGYTFVPDEQARVHRFLTLGTDGGTYYTSAKDLTKENAGVVMRAAQTDSMGLVRQIVEVSEAGRAPRQNPALFALAIAASLSDDDGRAAALAALPRVARTGTHLFLFARYVEQFRGWGRGLRKAVGSWYADKPADQLAYQACKYRQREGWTHRDLLRLSHPTNDSAAKAALYDWICGREHGDHAVLPSLVDAFVSAQEATTVDAWVAVINANRALSWEMLPDAALAEADVWRALISQGMPQTALMRQLPRLTRLGVLDGDVGRAVATQLQDTDRLVKARVHPVNVLVAQRTYASGRSARGESTWTPDSKISDALDAAFYNAYRAVEPANKRTLLALDVSASMTSSAAGLPVSCREASAALAMVTAATESDCKIVGFTSSSTGYDWRDKTALTKLDISPRRRLDDICRYVNGLPMGGTDCALPMVWALKNRVKVDTFQVYTDNETWHGAIHPHQALREYREKMGIDARLVVVAMTAGGATIADPSDPRQLDVSGFDSSVPNLLSDFSRGDI
jgi:60 kDa SS-A/Ro ribonucleoprotein